MYVQLTYSATGRKVNVMVDQIILFGDNEKGKCGILLSNGDSLQVEDTTRKVRSQVKKAAGLMGSKGKNQEAE